MPMSTGREPHSIEPKDLCRGESLHDGLPSSTHRQVSEADRIPQATYLGIEVEILEYEQEVRYGLCTHDGSYTLDYYDEILSVKEIETLTEKVNFLENHIIGKLKEYQTSQNFKAHLIGLGLRICNSMCVDYGKERVCNSMCVDYGKERIQTVYGTDAPSLSSRVWLELDAIPFVMRSKGHTLDERASTAVRQAVVTLSPQYPGNIPRVSVGYRNEVEVDCNGEIHLFDLEHYRASCSDGTWHAILAMAEQLKQRRVRVSCFSSTPQGGGVALMRHALIRLSQHLQCDVHWFVTTPSPDVFSITKRKFHNVLQGVAPPDVRLEDADKAKWSDWTRMNVQRHWDDTDGPLLSSDVIVIDDPQVCGLIPWIRKLNPKAKIIYRSHIEIRADLIREDPNGQQAQTWDFLWSAIKQADLFVSHPVANFVPDCVPMENVVMMPAATDPMDGLNKPISDWDMAYYQQVFNRFCYDQGSRRVDWSRPYITQIARFDPSKGIPDVLLSYMKLYNKYMDSLGGNVSEAVIESKVPQLIICGHGSIDDPDGNWVFEEAHSILDTNGYRSLWPHVTIVRIPPCDQILNVVMRGAIVALQLSHREGFEVKVTEAIAKGVPVIAYNAGGIPFQIKHGKDGYLVPVGHTDSVAAHLFDICTDPALRESMATYGKEHVGEDYFTVVNWANWAYLWLKILDKPRVVDPDGPKEGERVQTVHTCGPDQCLNIDGSTRPCAPELSRLKGPKDVLGGGSWVTPLWRREYVEGGSSDEEEEEEVKKERLPRFRRRHGHHMDAHRARTWFSKLPHIKIDEGAADEGGSDGGGGAGANHGHGRPHHHVPPVIPHSPTTRQKASKEDKRRVRAILRGTVAKWKALVEYRAKKKLEEGAGDSSSSSSGDESSDEEDGGR